MRRHKIVIIDYDRIFVRQERLLFGVRFFFGAVHELWLGVLLEQLGRSNAEKGEKKRNSRRET